MESIAQQIDRHVQPHERRPAAFPADKASTPSYGRFGTILLVETWRWALLLIAHRGGRGFGTDNTLQAMEEAVRAGVRMIETDVRMTADGELVLCHDPTIWGRAVSRMTAEELARHAPDRPLLRDVLERLAGWVVFDIEVKDASMSALMELLVAYGIEDDTLVTSFGVKFLDGLKEMFPRARTGFIYRLPYALERKLETAMDIGAEAILPYYNSISEELIADAHEFGLEVIAWTVNDRADFEKLLGWGIDGIITDRYMDLRALL
jgi:glycerophosphoryl diester phosphodiesterase